QGPVAHPDLFRQPEIQLVVVLLGSLAVARDRSARRIEPSPGAGAERIEVGSRVDRTLRTGEEDRRDVHAPGQPRETVDDEPMTLIARRKGPLVGQVERVRHGVEAVAFVIAVRPRQRIAAGELRSDPRWTDVASLESKLPGVVQRLRRRLVPGDVDVLRERT